MLSDIGVALPDGVWITSFNGQHIQGAAAYGDAARVVEHVGFVRIDGQRHDGTAQNGRTVECECGRVGK